MLSGSLDRASRPNCGAVGAVAIDAALGNLKPGNAVPAITVAALGILFLGSIVPHIAVTVRRQHDIGISGWFYLLIFLPYLGNLIILVFTLIPSQANENKWGPIPAGITPPPAYVPNS